MLKQMKKILSLLLFILISSVVVSQPLLAKTVGIWYSTIYSKEKNYNWATGVGVGTNKQFSTDVTGDGKADAITYEGGNGDWYVSPSDGTKFLSPSLWAHGFGVGGSKQFVSDVSGDGKGDIISFDVGNGDWWVMTSNGSSFNNSTRWISGHGASSTSQMVGDVNGDGKADAIIYIDVTGALGYWYVSTSTGSGFNNYSLWKSGYGHGSTKQFISDVTGDGKSDAVTYFDISGAPGNWYTGTSTGSGFNNYTMWAYGHGHGSNAQFLGDITGDGKSDAIVYFPNANTVYDPSGSGWYKGVSDGNGFAVAGIPWHVTHGNNVHHNKVGPANSLLMADVDGDSKQESIAYHNLYTNGAGAGQWKVLFEYMQPPYQNYWEALTIEHTPVGGQYDSGDPTVINNHLQQISDAGIDFILMDLTNGVTSHQFILDRAKAVCSQLRTFNQAGHNLKYAIAIGKVQYSGNTYDVEAEAQEVLNLFVNDPTCGADYFKINNVPLLESHFGSYAQKQDWLNLTTHTASNSFVVKYGQGLVPLASNYPSATGQGCGTFSNPTPPASDFPNYIGWNTPYGTQVGSTTTVMPGTNNKAGTVIKRTQNGVEGGFYTTCGWDRIQANKANIDMVVINSYNEYAEESAVAPTDTSTVTNIPPLQETWSSPSLYWNYTVGQINAFKN